MNEEKTLDKCTKKELIEIILRERREIGIYALAVLAVSIIGAVTIIDWIVRLVA